MRNQVPIVLLLFFVISSCNLNIQNDSQQPDSILYLKQMHNITLNDNQYLILFIPVGACNFCNKKTIDFLLQQKKISKRIFIVVAGLNNAEISPLKNQLLKFKVNLLIDKGYSYKSFESFRSNDPFYVYSNKKFKPFIEEINANNFNFSLPQMQKNFDSFND